CCACHSNCLPSLAHTSERGRITALRLDIGVDGFFNVGSDSKDCCIQPAAAGSCAAALDWFLARNIWIQADRLFINQSDPCLPALAMGGSTCINSRLSSGSGRGNSAGSAASTRDTPCIPSINCIGGTGRDP